VRLASVAGGLFFLAAAAFCDAPAAPKRLSLQQRQFLVSCRVKGLSHEALCGNYVVQEKGADDRIADEFIESRSLSSVDTSCVREIRRPPFFIPRTTSPKAMANPEPKYAPRREP
jgi:hypothetical protein